eukprot:9047240-Pyramimonas_sp.AAC.1
MSSASTSAAHAPVSSTLAGRMAPWQMPLAWQWAVALSSWYTRRYCASSSRPHSAAGLYCSRPAQTVAQSIAPGIRMTSSDHIAPARRQLVTAGPHISRFAVEGGAQSAGCMARQGIQ